MATDAARMMALFDGYADAHGTYSAEDRNESKGGKLEIKRTARTLREPVTEELWALHLSGKRPLGVITIRGDDTCLWGCVDVDVYDVSHAALVALIEQRKLPLLVCRTKSGGAHVFAFFREPVPAEAVAAALREVAALLGHGKSEVFPKQARVLLDKGDLGSWLNMPYYGGDASTRVCVKRGGAHMTLGEFMRAAEAARCGIDDLSGAGVRKRRRRGAGGPAGQEDDPDDHPDFPLQDGPPCIQHLARTGFPEGTRNTGLMAFGVFAKKKFGSRWKEALEAYNQDFAQPPLPNAEMGGLLKSLEKKDYGYKCGDEPICSHCNSVLCRTRKYGVGWSEEYPLLGGMTVMLCDPPMFYVDVDGTRLEIVASDLQNYRVFHRICMEVKLVCYQMLKQDTWLKMVSLAMKDAVTVEAPPEVGVRGHFLEILEDFCVNRHRGEQVEDLLGGKPWEDTERRRHLFRLKDLQMHLERAGFKAYTRPQITARLRDMGGEGAFTVLDGKGTNYWWIPSEAFQRSPEARPRRVEESPI